MIIELFPCFFKYFGIHAFIAEVEFAVMLADLAHHSARVADGNDVGGDILCHDAACADDGIIPYRDSRQHHRARAEPAIFTDMHGGVILERLLAQLGHYGMPRRSDGYIRAEHRMIADIYMRVVDEGEVEIRIHRIAEMDVVTAPIRVERRLDIAILPYLGKHLLEHGFTLVKLGRAGHIEVIEAVEVAELLAHHIAVVGVIDFAGVQFISLCH